MPARPQQRAARAGAASRGVHVWDLPIRLFHWLVAVLVAAAYATWRLGWMDWHERAGEAVLALLLFRILWGCFGSDTARFARFVASPWRAWRYLWRALRGDPVRHAGHNPAGGWMILLLLLLLLGETLTGLYVANDIADVGPLTELTPAPLANAIEAAHSILWDVLLAAILLHIVAIAAYAAKGQNLLLPMLTGRKQLPDGVAPPRLVGPAWAAAAFAAGIAAAAVIVNLL